MCSKLQTVDPDLLGMVGCGVLSYITGGWGGGVVGWYEGAVYLTSPGCPADIGLQLGKACYPCSG